MKRNIVCLMLTVAFFVLAVFSLGGCGGSSSDNSSSSNPSGRASIFVGTTGGSLYSALESKLGFASKLSDDAGAESAGSLGEGDIAVFGAGYFTSMNAAKTGLLSALYNNSVTIALLDADNAQINTMRTSLGLVSDDSMPTKESWDQMLEEQGLTTSVEWTGTAALYALAKRDNEDEGIYWNGANVLTYFMPDETAFASSEQSVDIELTSEDQQEIEKINRELQKTLTAMWDDCWEKGGFTEGTPATANIVEDDGTPAKVTYDGNNNLTITETSDGKEYTGTLTKGSDGNISVTFAPELVNEILSEDKDFQKLREEIKEAYRQYQEGRVQDFMDWCDGMADLNASMTADKAEITAAADDEVKLADLKGESKTWACSPPSKQKTLAVAFEGSAQDSNNPFRSVERSMTVNRKHTITINSYPIHNFTDGSDWYIIKLGGTLNPSGQYQREDRTGNFDLVWGHTGYYTLGISLYTLNRGYHSIQWLIHNSEKAKYTSGITLMDSSPKNVNRTAKKTVGLTMNLSGKLGISQNLGPNAEIGGGISRTDTTTYDIHDYENLNDSSGVTAKVKYNFAHPTRGSTGRGFLGCGLEDAVYTSRAAFTPDVRAVWRVEKSHWQEHGTNRTVEVTLNWADSIARGATCYFWATTSPELQEDYAESAEPYRFTPQPPMHFALGKKRIAASKSAQAFDFTILSEGNWTAEMDDNTALWCSLNQSSGSATEGDEEKQMMIQVAENTTGGIREGKVTFKLNGSSERHVLTVVQSSTDTLNH